MNDQTSLPAQTPGPARQQPVRPPEETEEAAFVRPKEDASASKPPAQAGKTPPAAPAGKTPPAAPAKGPAPTAPDGAEAPDAGSLLAGLDLFSDEYDDDDGEALCFPPAAPAAGSPAKSVRSARTPAGKGAAKQTPAAGKKPDAQSLLAEGRVLDSLEEDLADLMDLDYAPEPDELIVQRREFEASMYREPPLRAPDPMRPEVPSAPERTALSVGSVRTGFDAQQERDPRFAFDAPRQETPAREPAYSMNAPRRETSAREPAYSMNALRRETPAREPAFDLNPPRRETPAREPAYSMNALRRETPAREPAYSMNAPRRETPAREPAYSMNAPRQEAPAREPGCDMNAPRREAPAREPAYDLNAPRRETPAREPAFDLNAPRRETPAREPGYDMNAPRREAPERTTSLAAAPKPVSADRPRSDLRFAPAPRSGLPEPETRTLRDRDARRRAADRWMTARSRRRETALSMEDAGSRSARTSGRDTNRLTMDGRERKKTWKL